MYETENKKLPYGSYNDPNKPSPPGGYSGNKLYDRTGWWWFNFIEGFYKKSDMKITVVQCPSKWLTNPRLKNNILCGNYGVNRSICKSSDDRQSRREEFVGIPLSINQIPNPGKTLLIVDSGYAIISWWHVTDSPPVVLGDTIIEDTVYIPGLKINKDRKLWPGQEQDAIYGRHPNKTVNVGFVDGHISRIKADDLFVEKTDEGYKNKTPLWVPK
jgi:prepilin-type processing-associated H-X9-DG protein